MKITVFVTPKKNVLDPQGAAISHAMTSHGFKNLKGVRMGKMIELELEGELDDALRNSIDAVCRDLLSNPVIEDYRWTLEK
ncbi:MAG: phosphoribosylformylglycinamidine synthase subunit PurS [Opitutales bacterium]